MTRRLIVAEWLRRGLEAVDAESLTAAALGTNLGSLRVLAIGKAAPAMCRAVASVADGVTGLCIASHAAPVPEGIELLVGDHPIPGEASLAAGKRVLEMKGSFDVALISGGGSSLCEVPAPGLDIETIGKVTHALVYGGASIEETNLVRSHLSQIKSGGAGSMPTFVLSDVAGGDPVLVSSGPTIAGPRDPARALEVLSAYGVEITPEMAIAVERPPIAAAPSEVVVVADGRTAAGAVADASGGSVREGWLRGDLEKAVHEFIAEAGPGVTVAAGETDLDARGGGHGGRNTHATLLAARAISGTEHVFAALATDGVDGNSEAAGAIVDGSTIDRGGDPQEALARFDSATYLRSAGDLLTTGATGTNVADLWLIWKPGEGTEPILRP